MARQCHIIIKNFKAAAWFSRDKKENEKQKKIKEERQGTKKAHKSPPQLS